MAAQLLSYSGSYSWKITDPVKAKRFLYAQYGDSFQSDIFRIGGFKWRLFAYPKGGTYSKKYDDTIEGCELCLELLKPWPSPAQEIVFTFRLFCAEASSSYTNISRFRKYQSCQVWWYRGTLTTSELSALEGSSINLQCYINILQTIGKYKEIIYQSPYKYVSNNNNKISFEWKIKNLTELFINTKCGKHLESPIINNFWCLRCAPRGWKLHSRNHVALWLQLCCLPINISKITVRYEILCPQKNIRFVKNKSFSYKQYGLNAPWNQKMLLTNSLKGLNCITFKCNIYILKKYDNYGMIIKDNYKRNMNANNNNNNDNDNNNTLVQGTWVQKDNNALVQQEEKINQLPAAAPAPVVAPVQPQAPAPAVVPAAVAVPVAVPGGNPINELQAQMYNLMQQVNEIKTKINKIQSQIGVDDNPQKLNIMQMILETKKEIELIKQQKNDNNNDKHSYNPVKQWFQHIVGLPEYYDLFRENGFEDLSVIKMLTMDELTMLGIQKLGHKLKILSCIKKLNAKKKDNNNIHINDTLDGDGDNDNDNNNDNDDQDNEGHVYVTPNIM